jgi:ABC-type transport system involved in Fe-S cluster assembly fused permease/ATPase subunit
VSVVYQTWTSAEVHRQEAEAYKKSSVHAEQCLNSIKIVKAFNQENYEAKKYQKHLTSNNEINNHFWKYGFSISIFNSVFLLGRIFFLTIGALFVTYEVSLFPLILYRCKIQTQTNPIMVVTSHAVTLQ